jgi:hypothetical protein
MPPPLVLPELLNSNRQQMATVAGTDWVQAPTLAQPGSSGEQMMMILLLFLQKQNLAFAVYLLGLVLSLPDSGLQKKHM